VFHVRTCKNVILVVSLSSIYDPVVRHEAVERLVVRDVGAWQERKYWRFRCDRWYGGIVTADAVGCGLVCKYCWVSDKALFRPEEAGKFYRPNTLGDILLGMAQKRRLNQLRVSGGEPTIGWKHLLQLLDDLDGKDFHFILETNGILIGKETDYAKELSKYRFIHVRVSLKGCNEKEFTTLTSAKPEGFTLQLRALESLLHAGVPCHPAVMISFSTKQSLQELTRRLKSINRKLAEELETEELILYPNVKRKIVKHGLKYQTSYTPSNIPREQI